MPTLPETTTAFASSATEAQFKTFLSSQRSFLAGLLGTDGTAATARATLGVSNGVTSVNGNTGAVTAAQIAAAATAGYGYTPANSSHSHSDYVSTNMTHGAVGSLCFARVDGAGNPDVVAGGTRPGSVLRAAGVTYRSGASGVGTLVGATLSGTWRCLGHSEIPGTSSTDYSATLWQRIS